MGELDRRLAPLERLAARRPSRDRAARRAILALLTTGELEALEGALAAEEAGRPLTSDQEVSRAAWERASEAEDGGRAWAG